MVTGLYLTVRVLPQGGKDQVDHIDQSSSGDLFLKVRVKAPPTDGKANKAVVNLLADLLDVPKSKVLLLTGEKARLKTFCIEGDPAILRQRLFLKIV